MNPIQTTKMTNFRWVICALLFCATTVNYLDRQVLSLTWKDFIAPEFHWNDAHYGMITGFFSVFYAIACLFAGKFVDWMGIKKGYLWAIFIWSLGACMHAGCGWVTMEIEGLDSVAALRAVQAGSTTAVAIATLSVWLFLVCRAILALGEAGNFPAAIKVTAEYFPKKDRAFATSIFNSGASVGALAAPLTIPILAKHFGWEMAFIIIGAIGFIWMFFWAHFYEKPDKSKHVNKAELIYINQDENESPKVAEVKEEKTIPFLQCFKYKQTWSFVVGKFSLMVYGGSICFGLLLISLTSLATSHHRQWVWRSSLCSISSLLFCQSTAVICQNFLLRRRAWVLMQAVCAQCLSLHSSRCSLCSHSL